MSFAYSFGRLPYQARRAPASPSKPALALTSDEPVTAVDRLFPGATPRHPRQPADDGAPSMVGLSSSRAAPGARAAASGARASTTQSSAPSSGPSSMRQSRIETHPSQFVRDLRNMREQIDSMLSKYSQFQQEEASEREDGSTPAVQVAAEIEEQKSKPESAAYGKTLLVIVGSSKCPHCRHAKAEMQALHDSGKDEEMGVVMRYVSLDSDPREDIEKIGDPSGGIPLITLFKQGKQSNQTAGYRQDLLKDMCSGAA